ncbi:MAG TPA: polyprenyl synthetase family protein [Gemmatimonadaceae bacterium]|nr:polyprenyl synthetase family protein [Gemmatimonadaceae bacterium]
MTPSPAAVLADDRTLASDHAAVDAALAELCRTELHGIAPRVAEAIRYSLSGGGKRLRASLVCSAYRAADGTGDASGLAAAVEVVHAYSLVHDDLPCMDDDDMRRGRPAVHRVYGVAAATAAGLAMVPLAAYTAQRSAAALGLPAVECGSVVRELMHAAGASGMIGGQQLDLDAEGRTLPLPELERVHRLKTGALIAASARLGGMAARAPERALDALTRYGAAIGHAFQIADDVLDVTATSDELGKTAGRDKLLQKSTYPSLLGVDGAVDRARRLVEEACGALDSAGLLTPHLERLARFSITRRS